MGQKEADYKWKTVGLKKSTFEYFEGHMFNEFVQDHSKWPKASLRIEKYSLLYQNSFNRYVTVAIAITLVHMNIMLQIFRMFSYLFLLLLYNKVSVALDCGQSSSGALRVAYTITVDKSGKGNFTTIQSAIDHVPVDNSRWIRVQISPGVYREKVIIEEHKPCILLDGAGNRFTSVEWNDHEDTRQSATFTSLAANIVAKGITFKNTYNGPFSLDKTQLTQAVAAEILGDKSAFHECAFYGVQDTLWDATGRHFFHQCYIQGGVDFIFGNGQSLYEKSTIKYSLGAYATQYSSGYITAQGRESANDPGGFVFSNCQINGSSKAYLGRAWKSYSRVIIANSYLSEIVVPVGWDAWNLKGKEAQITYVEENCRGPGSDTSKRVPWMKKLSATELSQFLDASFIDQEGWLSGVAKLLDVESFFG
ncbi:putative pectinesterase 55 [Morella rubra]|uniref:pectinesterase n=1 Tax=Morella rubra TaxID=262757 RepID=A0A6A1UQ53_9ROSI|nr:putative pectinesterase 55 [Morella rubra]